MRNAFKRWMDYPFYPNFTGPTTRAAMQRIFDDTRPSLQGDAEPGEPAQDVVLINNGNASATNGAAMKAWSASMLSLGTPEDLIATTYEIAHFTHDNVISISGACAVSTAVNTALSDGTTLEDVLAAAIKGADQGYSPCGATGCNDDGWSQCCQKDRIGDSNWPKARILGNSGDRTC